MAGNTQGRVWSVTGCSSGFGRELVRAVLSAGGRVVATARRPESLADLEASGDDRVQVAALDVTDPESIDSAVRGAVEWFGRIDVLVNNAGNLVMGAVEEISMENLPVQMVTLFFGAAAVTKSVLPLMREQGSGPIVQMSSMGGQATFHAFGAYHADKFALE